MSLARELAPEPEPGPHAVPRRRAGPSRVWVLLLLTHAALLGLMLSRRLDFLFNDAMHRVGPASDFATYYVAGHNWLEGRSIYRGGYGFGYRYHPLFAMTAGAGLCHLPIRAAFALWVVLHELLLLADLWALRSLIPDDRRRRAFAALMLLFSPYYLEVYMGNASFVAASLLLFAFCLDRDRGPVLQASRTAVALLALRACWRARERLGVGVFLGSCIYLLAFGEVWEHSYSILVLGLAFLWDSDFVPPRLLLGCSIGLALPTAFALYDVALPPGGNDPEHHWSLLVSVLHHATKPLFLAPLFAACVIRAERIGGRRLPSG